MTLDIIDQFRNAMASHGIVFAGQIVPDTNNIQRFHVEGDTPGTKNGYYRLHTDGIPAGIYGAWNRDETPYTWCAKSDNTMTDKEREVYRKTIEECNRQRNVETQQRHSTAAKEAKRIWDLAEPIADANSIEYLAHKKIQSYGLRQLTCDVEYEVYPEEHDNNGNKKIHKLYKGNILAPCYLNGEIVNLESIYYSKKTNRFEKRPLTGGLRTGAYYMIGEVTETSKVICLVEGYATGATIYEATGAPTFVTFNCGNTLAVAQTLRAKYPLSTLVIITDDDRWHTDSKLRDAGLKAAKKACNEVSNTTHVLPNFSVLGISDEELRVLKPTDFNDLFVHLLANGLERCAALDTVRQQIEQKYNEYNEDIMSETVNNEKVNRKKRNRKKSDEKPKAAEILLQLIDQGEFCFFHDSSQDAFCRYPSQRSNVYETRRIQDRQFKGYLSYIFRQKAGKTIGDQALKEVLTELEGRALHDANSRQEKVFLRVGGLNEKIYIDLCNDKWQAIEICAEGWKVLDSKDIPIHFERSQHTQPLPDVLSTTNSDINKLWEIVNIPKDDQILVLAFILECYRCTTAFPLLVLLGLQDSGKSATQNSIRSLIDPSSSNLRTAPRKVDDLVTEAGANWLVSYNNVSNLSDEMHDDFCCIATGSGFATRKFYTNTQQIVVNIARPVVINGIHNFIRRPDLLDRALIVELDSIKEESRKTDSQLQKMINENLPVIFRGLLDLMAKVLRILPTVTLNKQPRMADFAMLGVAVEEALGLPKDTFINRYRANRADARDGILEASPIMLALVEFLEQKKDNFWRGRLSDLLDQLTEFKNPSIHTAWPKTPKAMSGELKRYIPSLRSIGIEVINEAKVSGKRNNTGNFYRISKIINNEKERTQRTQHTHDHAKASKDGVSGEPDSVHVQPSTYTTNTERTHSAGEEKPVDMGLSEESVHVVDVVHVKTQHATSAPRDNDSVLI